MHTAACIHNCLHSQCLQLRMVAIPCCWMPGSLIQLDAWPASCACQAHQGTPLQCWAAALLAAHVVGVFVRSLNPGCHVARACSLQDFPPCRPDELQPVAACTAAVEVARALDRCFPDSVWLVQQRCAPAPARLGQGCPGVCIAQLECGLQQLDQRGVHEQWQEPLPALCFCGLHSARHAWAADMDAAHNVQARASCASTVTGRARLSRHLGLLQWQALRGLAYVPWQGWHICLYGPWNCTAQGCTCTLPATGYSCARTLSEQSHCRACWPLLSCCLVPVPTST